jgi:hypothetical protein
MKNDNSLTVPQAMRSKPLKLGLALSILTILLGQFLGIIFGLNEDAVKSQLHTSATAVRDTVYQGDDEAMNKVESKSWTYMKRAHLHAGGMGTTALALIVLIGLLGLSPRASTAISVGLGAGGFGYSIFWMWAGFRAPGLGGTGAAKESLRWLAMPSSGAFVLATIGVLVIVLASRPDGEMKGDSQGG